MDDAQPGSLFPRTRSWRPDSPTIVVVASVLGTWIRAAGNGRTTTADENPVLSPAILWVPISLGPGV